jgi:hypothetical protein
MTGFNQLETINTQSLQINKLLTIKLVNSITMKSPINIIISVKKIFSAVSLYSKLLFILKI